MSAVSDFYKGIQTAIDTMVARIKPYRASVAEASNGLVRIHPLEADSPLDESFARLAGFTLAEGDEVVVLTLNERPFVLGKIWRSSSLGESFDVPILIEATADNAFLVSQATGDEVFRVDSDASSISAMNGAQVNGWSGEDRSGTSSWNIDSSSGDARFADLTASSLNTPNFVMNSQNGSTTASTTSTTTMQTAMTASVTLGDGIWNVQVIGGCQLTHSANGAAAWQASIGGSAGAARSGAMNSSTYGSAMAHATASSVTGSSVSCGIEFRSSAAGTTSARNPWIIIVATRTA